MNFSRINECFQAITDEDVLEAMREIPGYLDITPSDFIEVYRIAFDHAISRVKTAIRAEHIMTRNVVSVLEDAPLLEAAMQMRDHDISGVPVLNEEGAVTGVISEKDFLSRMNENKEPSFMQVLIQCMDDSRCLALPLKTLKARDIMSSPPVIVHQGLKLMDVANLLDRNNINRVPVSDDNNALVGIIARSDLVQAMC
ncbi:MAG: CBS domain-containing protein [Desulfobacter sp.]|nr:MAG: CBS domain-containing protein [Desulfobacter sp.]